MDDAAPQDYVGFPFQIRSYENVDPAYSPMSKDDIELNADFDYGDLSDVTQLPDAPIQCQSALEWILKPIDARQCYLWAERLVEKYGSLANTLAADVHTITELLDGLSPPAWQIRRFHQTMVHAIECRVRHASVKADWESFIQYLQLKMGQLKHEQVRVIFVNSRFTFISDEFLADGDLREAVCYPREVARRAVIARAAGAILVHNHPGGNSAMSRQDKSITLAVDQACDAVGVQLIDHLVICRDSYTSYRSDNPLWGRRS